MVDVVFPYAQLEYDEAEPGAVLIAPHASDGHVILGVKATWEHQDLLVVLSRHDDLDRRAPVVVGMNHIGPGTVWVISGARLSIDHSPETVRFRRSPTADREMIGPRQCRRPSHPFGCRNREVVSEQNRSQAIRRQTRCTGRREAGDDAGSSSGADRGAHGHHDGAGHMTRRWLPRARRCSSTKG